MDAYARETYSSGFDARSATASSSVRPEGTYPPNGSWALVWSVTMSTWTPRRSSSGNTSAAFPSNPMETASPATRESSTHLTASSMSAVSRSRYRVLMRRSIRDGSTSTQSATPSFSVTASGCAPPIPPSPAVSVTVPFSEPPCFCSASDPSVS